MCSNTSIWRLWPSYMYVYIIAIIITSSSSSNRTIFGLRLFGCSSRFPKGLYTYDCLVFFLFLLEYYNVILKMERNEWTMSFYRKIHTLIYLSPFFFLFLGNILSPVCNIKVINLILLLSLRISDNYGNKFVKDFRNKKKKIRHEIE